MSSDRSRTDRSIPLRELSKDAATLEPSDFAERHGDFFLVRSSVDGTLAAPPPLNDQDWNQPTKRVMRTQVAMPVLAPESPRGGAELYVYPIRKRRGEGTSITIGRTPNNDICIADVTLSKSHASFEPAEDGGLLLVDRQSRNGTFVGDHRLEPEQPTSVPFGKTIQFGSVRVTYMPAVQLMELIRFLG